MGTNVVSGTALSIIVGTGNKTYFGSMTKSLYSVNEKNSFEKGVDSVSKLLIKFMVVMVPIILIINLYTKGNWWESLIFAITIAVGLTPEMLPVIMTSTLAKGAVDMSKKKTIVKRLKGNESKRVLKHAFLNSYFQTGLKNLIDVAIISRAEKENMNILKETYIREDEIPFDFSRRRMSVVLRDQNDKRQLITKGAVDEQNMVLIGFVGFLDPPKESTKQAINALKKHGVDTVVLTGDSEGVAVNVCKKVGISTDN